MSIEEVQAEGEAPKRGGRRGRGGGRAGNKRGQGAAIKQIPWSIPQNHDKPTEPLPLEGVEAIHNAAMRVLEEIGIEFLNLEAAEILQAHGAELSNITEESALVKMDRSMVMEKLKTVPSQFTLTPRNTDRKITIGGNHIVFGNVSSPPNYSNLDEGRKIGNRKAYQDFIKLTQYFNCLHFAGGYPVEPMDIHPSVRHLDCFMTS